MAQEPQGLEDLLDRIDAAAEEREQVSLDTILDATGQRSFGPLLLLAGLIILAPLIGDIPGMPTAMGVLVLLTAGQLLFRREHFWLPGWLLNRSVGRDKLRKGVAWLRRPAGFVDRWTRTRLQSFAQGAGVYGIAAVSMVVALGLPVMELIPFSANGAGLALTAFGLALIAGDGLLALAAFAVTAATFGAIAYGLI